MLSLGLEPLVLLSLIFYVNFRSQNLIYFVYFVYSIKKRARNNTDKGNKTSKSSLYSQYKVTIHFNHEQNIIKLNTKHQGFELLTDKIN